MTQLNKQIELETLNNNDDDIFTYNGSKVKIITVFNDSRESTALVEDENGEIFQVPKASLR